MFVGVVLGDCHTAVSDDEPIGRGVQELARSIYFVQLKTKDVSGGIGEWWRLRLTTVVACKSGVTVAAEVR